MAGNHQHEIVLFHSVLGVRRGVTDAAERLRAAGHTVHVPNLYEDGVVFDDYDKGIAYVESIGSYAELLKRTREAVANLPSDMIYAGFSNGGASAEYLAATRPGAKAALLFSAALPLEMLLEIDGNPSQPWPSGVPVQVHYTVDDPFRDEQWTLDKFRQTVEASGSSFAFYEYPGDGHLFTDASLPQEHDAEAAEQFWTRVLAFLSEIVE